MFHEFFMYIYLSARNQSESLATNFSENKGYRLLQCFNMRLYKHLLTHIYPLQYAKKLSFFRCWWKFRIAESHFSNYWVGMVKNGQELLDHETVKSGVSRKWFDELNTLMEWFLHADFRDGITIGLTANQLCIFAI